MKVAIVSTSRIVAEFVTILQDLPEVTVTALCCRPQSRPKAEAWAAQYPIGTIYTDEAALLDAGGFDAVYIGTANHLHYATARRVLEAGYHVILEKPFTVTAAEARDLFALADAKGVMLFEAITTPYLPEYRFLLEQLPAIGPVHGAMASFCARSRRYNEFCQGVWNTTFDPACHGGALNDMNVYNLHYLWGLLGTPQRAVYHPTRAANGIDISGLAVLEYPDVSAACLAAKDADGENGCVIQGPQGRLVLRGGTNALEEVWAVHGGGDRLYAPKKTRHRMAYEFAAFARMIENGDRAEEAQARRRTLAVMDLLDQLHRSAGAQG
ncbi:Gfo/Idh/MocA family oxidoreductase [uncultured Gemmiger sp.]|uniref:Gfo/Idh/MocA family protein n=1 Tax=uncultured Gemmiger sp. TaxID=1623490 RepID=UPI0025CCA90C|nr:Gfo/Idh/MocA family oxidoreductase [uncultured Gemmiger sp.]